MSKHSSLRTQNWLLAGAVVGLAVLPLLFVKGEYSGSDGQAQAAIKEIHPTYKPWFDHVLKPPSSEVEGLLFATQAAIGSGIVCYTIGLYKGRTESKQRRQSADEPSD